MRFYRASGILLHPTSLPGSWGIGDLGSAAYRFVDFLEAAGQRYWQILPLGPTGYGDSPYQCFSAFAGNPLLVSIDDLIECGLITQAEAAQAVAPVAGPIANPDRIDYGAVIHYKLPLLRRSFARLQSGAAPHIAAAFEQFCAQQAGWLDDYALFMALKFAHGGVSWNQWEAPLRAREPAALEHARREHAQVIAEEQYLQFLFYHQWMPLKQYANERRISIIGDAPIFVAYDSADVWANPDLFFLDEVGNPTAVAGVPPDYFSATGQLWGNPLYRWDRMAARGYAWWAARLRQTLTQVDILRLDHFRGFEAYWEVPATEETAINGQWLPGPGPDLFAKLRETLGELPLIAEDLGLITPEVDALRVQFELPGMRVLHFAFGDDATNIYLPHNYESNTVVYTGTHDNNTTLGWFYELSEAEREKVKTYLGRDGSDIAWELMRVALMSVADIAVVPLQDVLRLGADARMNTPGSAQANWAWRFRAEALNHGLAGGLRLLALTYGRYAEAEAEAEEE